jgi:hypothetical protein
MMLRSFLSVEISMKIVEIVRSSVSGAEEGSGRQVLIALLQ